jgi:hypothetical protein
MASYSNSSYTNDFFNLSGIYFNSTGITTGLAPIESNSSLYLLKSGGTISSNLLINGSLDVKSTFTLETIGNVATAINEKQDLINDDDLSISKTLNLQNSLDDLQDNINLKQNIINDGDLTISKILDLGIILAGKQDVSTNNTSSNEPSLEPSSTNQFVGFRVETAQEIDIRVGTGGTIPFNVKTGGIGFLYDTHNMYNTTNYEYTIPVGFSGYWFFNMRLFIAEYTENKRRIHLKVTRGSSNFEPLQIGNFYGQVESLAGTIPVLEGDVIKVYVQSGDGGGVFIYASRDNCWFEGRYIA